MTNHKNETVTITEEEVKFLVALQNEWTDVIVGRLIATNGIEQLEEEKQAELITVIKQMKEMVSNIRLRLDGYIQFIQREMKKGTNQGKQTIGQKKTAKKQTNNKTNKKKTNKKKQSAQKEVAVIIDYVNISDDEKRIITGLLETLTIKSESLLEQEEYIHREILNHYIIQIKKIYQKAYQGLFSLNQKDELEDIDFQISQIINETKVRVVNQMNDTKQQLIQYVKEYVLFEIITFEDLKKYSIPILNQELAVVKEFHKLDGRIYDYLQEAGIKLILPEVHEKFSSQLHEILIAEAKEGFEKGEIIEVMNCGFQYKGLVLRRATVMAGV